MTKFLILLYFVCWLLAIIFYRKKLNLFYIYLVKLLIYCVLIFCRLTFLNYFLQINTFNISISFFCLLLGNILICFQIPKIVFYFKRFFKITSTNSLLKDFVKIVKEQEIFRRRLFSLERERYLYLTRFFYNKFSKNFVIFLYFLPHFIFCIFFLADILFNKFLFISFSIFSFIFLYNKLFYRIILFSGFWGNLFGLFDIIHPCHFNTVLEKSPSQDFYNDVFELVESFSKGTPIYQLFYKKIYFNEVTKAEWQSFREQCYLYKHFFIPALKNYHLAVKLRVFVLPCLWLYFVWSFLALSYVFLHNFFLLDFSSSGFVDSFSKDIFFIFLKVNFFKGLAFSLFFWIFYYFDLLYNLFFQKTVPVEILQEFYIPSLEEFFSKNYNNSNFLNFYKNYNVDSDILTEKEKFLLDAEFFRFFVFDIFFIICFGILIYLSYVYFS